MLERLRSYLDQSQVIAPAVDELLAPAAVLVAITTDPEEPSVLLTRRADHLKNHSGEVSLPGGKWEPQDSSLEYTALRETQEEIGLSPDLVEVLGPLPVFQTWQGISVVPFVGLVPTELQLTPNLDELDAIFQVPLRFFLQDERVRTDVFERNVGHLWSPAYEFDGFEIWGFTARLLVNLLNEVYDAGIDRDSLAPIKEWPPYG